MKSKKVARGGRPPRGPYSGKSSAISTRVTADLRKRLDRAAARSDRSLSQEIEHRLDHSFYEEDALTDAFGGPHNLTLMRVLGAAAAAIEVRCGKTWVEDPRVLRDVRALATAILTAYEAVAIESPASPPLDNVLPLEDILADLFGHKFPRHDAPPFHPVAAAFVESPLGKIVEKTKSGVSPAESSSTSRRKKRKTTPKSVKKTSTRAMDFDR